MTWGVQFLRHLYAVLLRLYPPGFRADFGAEMEAVFAEAVSGVAERGWISLLGFLQRELRDWPGALWQAHWYTIKEKTMMGEKRSVMQARRVLIIIGGVILVVGSRLPWMSVPVLFGVEGPTYEAIEIGWEDNGVVTGGIGLVLLLGGLFLGGRRRARYSVPGAVLAALAIVVVAGCVWRVFEVNPSAGFFAATDVGLYTTFVGGLVALVGVVLKKPISLNP